MSQIDLTQTTSLLRRVSDGDRMARGELFALLYDQLRLLARGQAEGGGKTMQPTALVHELWLRLSACADLRVENRQHFLNIAAGVMRRILIDHARMRNAKKRGSADRGELLDEMLLAFEESPSIELLELDAALDRLAVKDERLARVVELRFFGGLTEEEAASALGWTRRQVQHAWKLARGFLIREIERGSERNGSS